MGTSWSRSKKVSPECVKAENLSKSASSSKHGALFRPLSIHGLLRAVRTRAPQDRPEADTEHAPGDISARPETRSTDVAVRPWVTDEDTEEEPPEPRGGGQDGRGHARAEHKWSSSPLSPLRCPATDASSSVPSPAQAHVPPHTHRGSPGRALLAIPVQYNGSEEELMERIEREFS